MLRRRHNVDDDQTGAVVDDGVKPVHLGEHQVLEPGHPVEHLEDEVLLLGGGEAELGEHVPDAVPPHLDGLGEVGAVGHQLLVDGNRLFLTFKKVLLEAKAFFYGPSGLQ